MYNKLNIITYKPNKISDEYIKSLYVQCNYENLSLYQIQNNVRRTK